MSADWWLFEPSDCAHGDGCECDASWHGNLTYNLSPMLREAGWFWPDGKTWSKEYLEGTRAADLGEKVAFVVSNLRGDPERFKRLNPENGWGSYDGCLETMEDFLGVIEAHPDATVGTWF